MPYPPQPPQPRRDNRPLYILIGVLCALVVLLALVFLIVALRQKPQREAAPAAQEASAAQEAPAPAVKHDTVIIHERETVQVPAPTKQQATPKAQSPKPAAVEASNSSYAWQIKNLNGITNIRSTPNGQVCMKLKAHTRYDIYADARSGSWLRIASIYNATEGYWVRLHSSSTGSYWISSTILY